MALWRYSTRRLSSQQQLFLTATSKIVFYKSTWSWSQSVGPHVKVLWSQWFSRAFVLKAPQGKPLDKDGPQAKQRTLYFRAVRKTDPAWWWNITRSYHGHHKIWSFCFNSVHQFENSWVFLFPLPGLLPSSQYKLYEIPQAFCRITDGERLWLFKNNVTHLMIFRFLSEYVQRRFACMSLWHTSVHVYFTALLSIVPWEYNMNPESGHFHIKLPLWLSHFEVSGFYILGHT